MRRRLKLIIWWRRQGFLIRLLFTSIAAFIFLLLLYLQRPEEELSQIGSNLSVILLVNLIISVLIVLAFLIVRNIAKLVFDRRRNILGSKLRMRLVLAFVGLTLIPTVIIFMLASGLLSSAMEGWFGNQTEALFNSSIQVAREYNTLLKQEVEKDIIQIEKKLPNHKTVNSLQKALENYREENKLFSIRLLTSTGEEVLKVDSAAAVIESFQEPDPDAANVNKALTEKIIITVGEDRDASQFVRGYKAVVFNAEKLVLLVSRRISPELSHALSSLNESYREFEQIQLFGGPLRSAYLLTLALITGVILFAALWFGFYMAKNLSGPIQKLAEGTRAVAKGNYDFKIREVGDDEMSFLIKSFNDMTDDIKNSRQEAEKHRTYIETILANLAVGVIALDIDEKIININPAAAKLFQISDFAKAVGKLLATVLEQEIYRQIAPLLNHTEINERSSLAGLREKELTFVSSGKEYKVLCTIGSVLDSQKNLSANVLIFDDITELFKAQQMSVWREVARRIAHEIKNPLTPIQLSAQRLQKIFKDRNENPVFYESTQTIIENVDSIKRLANEFSNFARMPAAEFIECDLNKLISSCIVPYAENHVDIVFQFVADGKLPPVKVDKEQIRRMVMNLIDNSIAALTNRNEVADETAKILIKTIYESAEQKVMIEVCDNGSGVNEGDKARIFEPYYTTKPGGSGLGLAIVTSIVSEHGGQISIYDNLPQGVRIIVELPLVMKDTTQRKFTTA